VPETYKSASFNYEAMLGLACKLLEPPPHLTVCEWAIRNRVLPKGTTSRPGPFKPEKFQIDMMNIILDPLVHEVVIMKSTQIGYSDAVLNNVCALH
jgi:phage terminase large subunit GpA-like protein